MAIVVIDEKPHYSVIKRVVCKHCGATLEFTSNDELRGYVEDYTGGRDYYNYINCPKCSKQVRTWQCMKR